MNEEEFKKLKRRVEQATAEANRAQGQLDGIMRTLKEEFECKDLKQARRLLKDLEEKRNQADEAFERAKKDYERKWNP